MALLALVWKVFGYSILSARLTMLVIASFGLLFCFLLAIRLARGSPGAPAFAAALFLVASPLFYTQSMMVLLDLPAMTLTLLALLLFLDERWIACAVACTVLVLVKETALTAPAGVRGLVVVQGREAKREGFVFCGAGAGACRMAARSASSDGAMARQCGVRSVQRDGNAAAVTHPVCDVPAGLVSFRRGRKLYRLHCAVRGVAFIEGARVADRVLGCGGADVCRHGIRRGGARTVSAAGAATGLYRDGDCGVGVSGELAMGVAYGDGRRAGGWMVLESALSVSA